MTTTPSELQHVGPYRLIEKIGEGGMGVVHLGVSPDGGLAAVKVLRPWLVGGQDARDRFEHEFAALGRVRGGRVAEVLDADVGGDVPYIATRYVRGSSLDKVVRDHGPLRGHALIRLADGLAEAVAAVHQAGVVHRDIKPGNVMMTDNGPVLIDFGLARAVDETRLTATGLVIGTPGYLAPEVVDGQPPQPASDVHGWAATVVFAAAGKPPYGAGPAAVVLDRIRRGEVDLGDVEPGMAAILQRALVADPAARPAIADVRGMLAEPDAAATQAFHGDGRNGGATPNGHDGREQSPVPEPDGPGPAADGQETGEVPTATNSPTVYARPTRIQEVPLPAADRAQVPPGSAAPGSAVPGQPGTPSPAADGAVPVPPPRARKPATTLWPDGIAPPLATWPARLVIVAAATATGLLLGVANELGVLVLFIVLVVGRVAWRVRRTLYYRRVQRGYQPRDNVAVAAGTPWYVLISMATSLLHIVLIGAVGYGAGWAVNQSPDSGPTGGIVVSSLVVVILAWLGPGTSKVRHGIRGLAASLDRNNRAAWIVFGVLFVLVWILLLIWENYPPTWPPGSVP